MTGAFLPLHASIMHQEEYRVVRAAWVRQFC